MNGALTKRAAAVGMFDGVHLGHQLVIGQVVELALKLGLVPTAFTFDCHPLSIIASGRAPLQLTSMARRAQLLSGAGAADVVFLPFGDIRYLSAAEFLTLLHTRYGVDALVVGFNHHFGHGRAGSFDEYRLLGADCGIEVVRADEYVDSLFDQPVSSSTIRRMLDGGDLSAALRLLGHPFCISGKVVHGHRLGYDLGFPTANLKPFLPNQQLPAHGAYAARARTADGSIVPAMVNIGNNPTIGSASTSITIEAHLIDYDADLYGSILSLDFVARLRDEHKFDSLDCLTRQLSIDRLNTLNILNSPN